MKPRTKIEKEVCGYKLPHNLTVAQTEWALSLTKAENARKFRGKNTDIVHFGIATTHHGWQVIRQFYMYAHYAYGKLKDYWIGEVMRTWLKDGECVYFCRPVQGMSYLIDSWCFGSSINLKKIPAKLWGADQWTNKMNLAMEAMKPVKVQKKYRYIPKEALKHYDYPLLYKAVNASKYCETLMKQDFGCFKWCVENGFAFQSDRMEAVKIAKRYNYGYQHPMWEDMISALCFLNKDLHNPKLICPENIQEAHDKWAKMAQNRKTKMMKGLVKARMIKEERDRLEREERLAQYEATRQRMAQEKLEKEKALANLYPKKRKKFFGLVIAENDIEIKVLQSVREFFEEGKEMEHCVFSCGYYDVINKPNCLILSAKVNGKRMETIEVGLDTVTIKQCRGKNNQDSEYHQQIMDLMNRNLYRIGEINGKKRAVRRLVS